MKRQLVLTLAIVFIFVLFSCETDLGTPPALVLSFSIDFWEDLPLLWLFGNNLGNTLDKRYRPDIIPQWNL